MEPLITKYINMYSREVDRVVRYVPKNSKYAKYAYMDAGEFSYQQVNKLKDKYHGKEV